MSIYHTLQSREMQKEENMKWAQRKKKKRNGRRGLQGLIVFKFFRPIFIARRNIYNTNHIHTHSCHQLNLCVNRQAATHSQKTTAWDMEPKSRGNGRDQSLQYPGNIPERLLLKWSIVSYLCLPVTLTSPSLTSWFLQTTNTSSILMDQHCAKQAKIQRMKKTKKADFLFDFSITPLRHIKSTPNCTSTPSPNLIFFNFLY